MIQQLLIVEDDKSLNLGLTKALQAGNRNVVSCFDLRSAREQLMCGGISAVILDVNLPDGSGLELLHDVKRKTPDLPVILLTANDTDMDIVDGLERGADDYITKPFSLAILAAVLILIWNRYKTKTGICSRRSMRLMNKRLRISRQPGWWRKAGEPTE